MATLTTARTRLFNFHLLRKGKCDLHKLLFVSQSTLKPQTVCQARLLYKSTCSLNFLDKTRHCQVCHQRQKSSSVTKEAQIDLVDEKEGETATQREDASEVLKNLSPDDARRLKVIKLEFEVAEQMGQPVPDRMSDENWLEALKMDSMGKRARYYVFLRKNEFRAKKKERKRALRQQEISESPEGEEKPTKEAKNTFLLRVYDATVDRLGNHRLANAMQFGQPLVFDMDYEQYMRRQDCQHVVSQMLHLYSHNRDSMNPFHLMLTSLDPSGHVFHMLKKAKLTGVNFMGTMTDKSYLDLFPREQLVYLTPHCRETLTKVNEDDVYIVGGFVDKTCPKPISLARAKEQGLRMAKFPLDDYLLWGQGSKYLTLDQVMKIILEQRRTKSWEEAFKAIPKRKLERDDM